MRGETMAGLRYVLEHPYLRSIAFCTATSNLFGQLVFAILVVYLVRQLHLTPETIGLIFSLGAVGFLLGALTANRIARRFGVGRTIVGTAFLFGPGALLIGIAPQDAALPLVVAGQFIGGFAGVVYNINQVSLRQAITPERMQGRMNATMRFLVWGTIPIGSVMAGILGTSAGIHETILLGGGLSLLPFLFVLLSPVRTIVAMPQPPDDARGQAAEALRAGDLEEGVLPAGHAPFVGPGGGES
jgi:MFS family permease